MSNDDYARFVFCSFQFSAVHCWPFAYSFVDYLTNPHRHLFKVTCRAPVRHNDRDVEFISLKEMVGSFSERQWGGQDIGSTSCEDIAQTLLDNFKELDSVTVSEDGENGATLQRL